MGQEQSRPIEVNLENVEDIYVRQIANQKAGAKGVGSSTRSTSSPERRPAVQGIAFEGAHAPQAQVLRPSYSSFMCYTPTRACVGARSGGSPERQIVSGWDSPERRSRSASPVRSPGRSQQMQLIWQAPGPSPQCFYYSPACVCGSNVSHSPERRTGRLRSDCSPDRSPNRSPDRMRSSQGCHRVGCASLACGCSNEANLAHSPERRARGEAAKSVNPESLSSEHTEAGNKAQPCQCPACKFFNGGPPGIPPPANVVGSPRGEQPRSSNATPTDWRSPAVRQTVPRGSIAELSPKKVDGQFVEALEQAMAWDNLTSSVENEALQQSPDPSKDPKQIFMNSLGLCKPRTNCSHCCATSPGTTTRNGDENAYLEEGTVEVLIQSPVLHSWKPSTEELDPVPLNDDLLQMYPPPSQNLNLAEEMALGTAPLPVKADNEARALTQAEIDAIVCGLKDSPERNGKRDEDCNSDSKSLQSPPSEGVNECNGRSPDSPGCRQRVRRSPRRRLPNSQRQGGAGQTCDGSPRRRSQRQNTTCVDSYRQRHHNDMIIAVGSKYSQHSEYTTSL